VVIGKLGMVMLIVSDMKRSVAFYRDALGLEVKHESEPWSELSAGTISIGLHHPGDEPIEPEHGAVLMFYVDDAARAVEELRAKGVEIVRDAEREEYGGVLAAIADPDGYPIQLLQT
jgi:catechol 2,3-dioxygenase-like lactoylglutathione lyase family enzyme